MIGGGILSHFESTKLFVFWRANRHFENFDSGKETGTNSIFRFRQKNLKFFSQNVNT